jgi:hypothetical protein
MVSPCRIEGNIIGGMYTFLKQEMSIVSLFSGIEPTVKVSRQVRRSNLLKAGIPERF